MSGELIHRLLFSCNHQFSWPRRTDEGDYYQLCVHCGTKYRYDWTRMKRVARIGDDEEAAAPRPAMRKCGTKTGWTPRERRLHHRVQALYRMTGAEDWLPGVTDNISRSGLLFRAGTVVDVGSSVELVFEMPRELTGDAPSRVLCRANVVRVVPAPTVRKRRQEFLIACTIEGYDFIAEPQQRAG